MKRRFARMSFCVSPRVIACTLALCVAVPGMAQQGAIADDTGEPTTTTSVPVVQSTAPSPTRTLNAALARLARDPRDMTALVDAGSAALDLGDTDAAIGFFTRAEQIAPGNAGVRARVAITMLRSNQPFEAIRWFDSADQAGFPAAEMATERGLAYDLIGDNAAAQHQYQLALAGRQDDEASRRYALSLVIAGDRRGAELVIQPLLERRDRGAWRVRTFIMAIAGQSDEAEGIARATMPADLATAISPYLRYLPRLTPAQQAAAANLGRFPRAADIGRDDPQIVQYALAHPRAPRVDAGLVPAGAALGGKGRDDRDNRSKRRRPGRDEGRDRNRETAVAAAQSSTPPAVSVPWGLQPGTRSAATTPMSPPSAMATPAPPPASATRSALAPAVLSRLDVPPGTPLSPPPPPTPKPLPQPVPTAATSVAAMTPPPSPAPAPRSNSAPQVAFATAVPASTPAAQSPGVSSPTGLTSAVPTAAATSPAGAVPPRPSLALVPPASSQAAPMIPPATPIVPTPVTASSPAPVLATAMPSAATSPTSPAPAALPTTPPATPAPADFRSAFDGFKPPEQEAASTTAAVDLARLEALRQSSTKPARGKDKDKAQEKQRGDRPDGPTAVSRTSDDEAPAQPLKSAKDKTARDKAETDKASKEKAALDKACLELASKAKAGKGAKTKVVKGKTGSKFGKELVCPTDTDKKGKAGKNQPSHASRIWVQVLTGANRDVMGREWQRLVREAALLKARKPYLTPWRSNFRLLTGPFDSSAEAQAFLDKLRKDGVSGFEWTSPAGQAVDGLQVK